jgi:hypothetical protein
MDHVRVGGVFLLLLIIAAALPINAFAQTPQPAASSASENDNPASDSASIISQGLHSESSAQAETISAETMAKRSTGLKPLGSSDQTTPTAASNEAAGTDASSQEGNEQQGETGMEAAPTADKPMAEETITPDMIQTETAAEPPAALSEPAADQEALDAAATEAITPPEDVALGTAVPAAPTADEPMVEETVMPDVIQTETAAEPPAALSEPAADQEVLDAAVTEAITPPEDAAMGAAVPAEEEVVVSQNAFLDLPPLRPEESDMTLSVPAAIVDTPVTIRVKSGNSSLSGVEILLNGSSVGNTDYAGSFTYTPTSAGTSKIVAKKTGYKDGQASLVVRTAAEASEIAAYERANVALTGQLTLNAPAEVVKGENFLISVVQGINRTPVEEAGLFLDNVRIGSTGSQGTMTYFVNARGEHTLKAEKEGFDPDTKNIMVASSLKVVGLTLPEKAYAGSEMEISAIVRNTGSQEDSRLLELKANDTVVDSKNATVKGGENSTISFSYKPKDMGVTKFSLDEQSQMLNVEEAKSNIWLIALILVLLIAIGGGYYLYSREEPNKLQREVKRLMQGR